MTIVAYAKERIMTTKADNRLRRLPERGSKDFGLACAIIDAARIAHV